MKVRVEQNGGFFLGCGAFPTCRGTRPPPPELVERMKAAKGEAPAPPRLALELPREVVNSRGMRFVLIPAGTFLVGSATDEAMRGEDEGPSRLGTIDRPFYLG